MVDPSQTRGQADDGKRHDGHDMHDSREPDTARYAKPDGNRMKPLPPIELHVLTGIKDVESTNPGTDGYAEQPGLDPRRPARGNPPADWRDSHRQPKIQLGIARDTLGHGIPEDN